MAYRVGKCRLLPHENALRNQLVLLKGVAQQIFPDPVSVQLFLRIDVHHIIHKCEITEGDSRFQRVHGDASVRAQNVIHMDLMDPLLSLFLEGLRIRREVGIFVAEQLIGDLSCQDDADVGVLMDPFADKIHADRSPDRRDIVGAERPDDRLQRTYDIVARDDDFLMVALYVVCDLPGILEVDRVDVHPDGECPERPVHLFCGNAADERGVESAGEEVADRSIGVQSFFDSVKQQITDLLCNLFL